MHLGHKWKGEGLDLLTDVEAFSDAAGTCHLLEGEMV